MGCRNTTAVDKSPTIHKSNYSAKRQKNEMDEEEKEARRLERLKAAEKRRDN